MKWIVAVVILILGFTLGIVYEKFRYQFNGTHLIVTQREFHGRDGYVLPKGTVLNYVNEMPEGYIQANLSIAIEGEAIINVEKVFDKRPNFRHQYFYDTVE